MQGKRHGGRWFQIASTGEVKAMTDDPKDLIAATAAAEILARKLDGGDPPAVADDEFRHQLAEVRDELRQRLDDVSPDR